VPEGAARGTRLSVLGRVGDRSPNERAVVARTALASVTSAAKALRAIVFQRGGQDNDQPQIVYKGLVMERIRYGIRGSAMKKHSTPELAPIAPMRTPKPLLDAQTCANSRWLRRKGGDNCRGRRQLCVKAESFQLSPRSSLSRAPHASLDRQAQLDARQRAYPASCA
jgi:hypothetical protein